MKNWSGFLSFLSRFHKLLGLLFLGTFCVCKAQAPQMESRAYLHSYQPANIFYHGLATSDTTQPNRKYPDPHKVLFRSLMIPGWGQIINKQAYKVPIVYLLLGGLTGYSIYLTKRYHDYRAAYYNKNSQTSNDRRFGPTPAYLQNANLSFLKDQRNVLHNRRDFMYITIVLAYGLNALDAYIFAHLRSFNVSKNLSVRPVIKPGMVAQATPGITFSFALFRNKR
jgi:hypothetical protein